MTTISKEKLEALKLNAEENAKLNDFIGKAVRNNYKFSILTNKAAVTVSGGIQEVYNEDNSTLITWAGILDKKVKEHVTNFDPLAEGPQDYMVGRVRGTDLLDILKLIIREKAYTEAVQQKASTIKQLKAKIDDMKTPEEKRRELEGKLAALEG